MLFVSLVCEVEIECGLLKADNPKRSCVWFHRIISGLPSSENAEHPNVLKYVDYGPNGVDSNDEAHPQSPFTQLEEQEDEGSHGPRKRFHI